MFTVHVHGYVVHYVSFITPLSTTAVPACLGFLCHKTPLTKGPMTEMYCTCPDSESAILISLLNLHVLCCQFYFREDQLSEILNSVLIS